MLKSSIRFCHLMRSTGMKLFPDHFSLVWQIEISLCIRTSVGMPASNPKGLDKPSDRTMCCLPFSQISSGEGIPVGLLKVKVALVFNISNTIIKRKMEVFRDPLDALWNVCLC